MQKVLSRLGFFQKKQGFSRPADGSIPTVDGKRTPPRLDRRGTGGAFCFRNKRGEDHARRAGSCRDSRSSVSWESTAKAAASESPS